MTNATERRCKARNKRGEPCQATVVGADGYCIVHDPERNVDMRELGRRGGKANGRPNPERVHEGLRAFLQREVPPERVWQALEAAMLGSNEAARVSASKVLIDALSEGQAGGCPDCAARAVEAEGARERLDTMLLRVVESVLRCLLLTGEPAKTDPVLVRLTLERIRSDERLGQAAAFLASTRTIEEELESRTAELTLERDEAIATRDQALARLAEFRVGA
jgi:hypothetical protein